MPPTSETATATIEGLEVEGLEATATAADEGEMSEELNDGLTDLAQEIREKMLHNFEIYPYLSRAMVQAGLGPACPPKIWSPILEELVSKGDISKFENTIRSPNNRAFVRTVYHLPTFPYPPITAQAKEAQAQEAKASVEA